MELNDITIRPFLPKEWPMLKVIRLRALKENPGLYFASYDDAKLKPDSFWENLIDNADGQSFGLFDCRKLIGLTGVWKSRSDESGKTAQLVASYIGPEYRGLGLSRLLYQARIDWAREKGFGKIAVGHREGNEASKAANQKFGFVFVEKEEIDFPDGRAFDYRYELKL